MRGDQPQVVVLEIAESTLMEIDDDGHYFTE